MPAGSHPFQVGSLRCNVLSDGYSCYPTRWMFPDAQAEELRSALESRRLPLETILTPYTCLLIETGRNVVLVDAGAGVSRAPSGAILARLDMVGVRPRDVDTVILTHAHPDHIGGAVESRGSTALRPAFPNARFVLSEAEWEYWNSPHPDLSGMRLPDDVKLSLRANAIRCLTALRHQVELIEGEREVLPGIRALPAPGHTPGHMALALESGGEKFLNLGDAAVHPFHLRYPEWSNGFDWAPATACQTRRMLLERATAENTPVMAFHFPFPSIGRLSAREHGGWDWVPGY